MIQPVSYTDSRESFGKMQVYSIGELSQLTGCHIESIRQYERKGLINKPYRTENGHRRYGKHHLSVLRMIMQFRRADFSLNDIKLVLDDLNQDFAPCGKMENSMLKYAQIIEDKRKALDQCEDMIETMTGSCLRCHVASDSTIMNKCLIIEDLVQLALEREKRKSLEE